MEISRLEEFVCLATTLNYHAAANQCYINQSTLSKHIRSLETELGCQLFIRNKREVKLTPFGESLLENANDVIESYDQCIDGISKLKDSSNLNLSIGYHFLAGQTVLNKFFKTYRDSFDEYRVELYCLTGEVLRQRLDSGALNAVIDMDIGYHGDAYSRLPFYRDQYGIYVSPDHRLANLDTVKIEDLRGETIISPAEKLNRPHENLIEQVLEKRIPGDFKIHDVLSDPLEIPLYAENGIGIGMAPCHVSRGMAKESLICIPIDEPLLRFNISVIWRRDAETHALHKFIRMFSAMIHEQNVDELYPSPRSTGASMPNFMPAQ